jgi:hypothetical protein
MLANHRLLRFQSKEMGKGRKEIVRAKFLITRMLSDAFDVLSVLLAI